MSDRLERPSRAGTGRDWLGTLAASAGLLCLYFVAPFGQDDDPLPLAVATTLSVAVVLVLAAMVSKRILRVLDGNTTDSLPGLAVLLTVVVVAFAAGYFMLARSDPAQMDGLNTRLDALYFTLTTLATVGYGDIHPVGQQARAIASLQFVFNAIFLAGLVRAMLYQAQARRTAGGR